MTNADRKVTVTLNTVRERDFYRDDRDVLLCACDDLRAQTLPASDFELVIVDGLHPYRAADLAPAFAAMPFRVTHLPPRDTPMVRDRRVAIAGYKNTAVIHARGELVVCTDDLCTLDPEFLERAWNGWKRDGVMLAALSTLASGEIIDSRKIYLDASGKCVGPVGGNPEIPPQYGFCAVPLAALLELNGWDEMFDGSQGLEDADLGIRLQKAGYRVGLDRNHRAVLAPSSTPWDERVFPSGVDRIVKCCQATARIQWARGDVRANARDWTEEWGWLTPCYLARGRTCTLHSRECAYPDTFAVREHEGLVSLKTHPPVFDLRELRRQAGTE